MINLQKLYDIQKVLNDAKYPDYKRVSKEILDYVKDEKQLQKILKEIKKYKPWEYIRGSVEFYALEFKINKNVLIPRIETEKLVSIGIQEFKDKKFDTVVDVGTGSGCVIISLVKSLMLPTIYKGKIKDIKFVATDIDNKALPVVKKNIKEHQLNEVIKAHKADLISKLKLEGKNVLILANLPYIPTAQYKELNESVRMYEPKIALDGGKDGNKYYRKLAEQLAKSKLKSFTLILETEESIIQETQKIFKKYKTQVIKDIQEKDRFLIVRN